MKQCDNCGRGEPLRSCAEVWGTMLCQRCIRHAQQWLTKNGPLQVSP